MKTNLEWYQELPEPFKSQAITNCTNWREGSKLHLPSDKLSSAIEGGFDWEATWEGYQHWYRLFTRKQCAEAERNTRSSPL